VDGETYTNVKVGVSQHTDLIGLRFLARHLVTLDFPHRTIYLKRTSNGPIVGEHAISAGRRIPDKSDNRRISWPLNSAFTNPFRCTSTLRGDLGRGQPTKQHRNMTDHPDQFTRGFFGQLGCQFLAFRFEFIEADLDQIVMLQCFVHRLDQLLA